MGVLLQMWSQRASRVVAWVVLCATVAFVLFATQARADGGVPIPGPAGTEWKIAGGYNTRTHSEADGEDPHAIDIVRTDAATDWTPVLSPTDGVVRWFDNNCVMIVDRREFAHLLCHLDPDDRISRGLEVAVGDRLGLVFPAGYDANGGLAHIHYAVHHYGGSGYLGRSIPFAGEYALEGTDLHWSEGFNVHAGREFVSSNGPGWTAPGGTVERPVEETRFAIEAPVGGWRMVGVAAATTVAAHFASLGGSVEALYLWHAEFQHFERYHPDAQSAAFVGGRRLAAGSAVWAEVGAGVAWVPAPTGVLGGVEVGLAAGRNLVSWHGAAAPVGVALAGIPHLSHAYRWNAYAGVYEVWAPGTALDSVWVLNSGDAVWVVVDWPGVWVQG